MSSTNGPRWRPPERVRAVSIGLAVRNGRLLVVEVLDDTGAIKGWRPPGGGIQFGERARNAVAREFREELKCEISIDAAAPLIFENIFEHEGAVGHEIVFAFPVTLLDTRLYERPRFQMSEDGGTLHWAEWMALSRFRSGEHTLYPEGLTERLT